MIPPPTENLSDYFTKHVRKLCSRDFARTALSTRPPQSRLSSVQYYLPSHRAVPGVHNNNCLKTIQSKAHGAWAHRITIYSTRHFDLRRQKFATAAILSSSPHHHDTIAMARRAASRSASREQASSPPKMLSSSPPRRVTRATRSESRDLDELPAPTRQTKRRRNVRESSVDSATSDGSTRRGARGKRARGAAGKQAGEFVVLEDMILSDTW